MKLLFIEDEELYLIPVKKFLERKRYLCECASSYNKAYDKIILYEYDCVILDLKLPDGNGLNLLTHIRKSKPNTGIIIASSRNSSKEKIEGLLMGADDYIGKPYELDELEARILSIIRRRRFNGVNLIEYNEIKVDPMANEVMIHHRPISLTKTEFRLLLFFITHKNKIVSKEFISEYLYEDQIERIYSFDFLYTLIKKLRKKLLSAGAKDYIKTLYGSGYKWSE